MHKLVAVVIFLATTSASFALNLETCNTSLGLESGAIKDSDITASSSYDASNVGPQFARLHQDKNGGAWCPKQQVMRGIKEWIEIDLKTMHAISSIQTQGRFGNGQGQEYVEQYKLEYWRPGMERWTRYRDRTGVEIFTGNTNTYMVTKNTLDPVILANKIRLVPYSLHRRTVCLRMELSGCPFQEGVVSYSAPQGDVFRSADLIDERYDGIVENGFLKGGLGQLIDGRTGHDNVEVDATAFGKGHEWVGWQNKTNAPRLVPLELTFEFEGVRNFSRIDVFANNDYHKHIQVFSELRVLFSIGGRHFPSDGAVTYFYMPDLFLDNARNVSIHLDFKLARYLKLQFTFAAEWFVISEIYFQSEQVEGNFSDEVRARGRQTDEGYLQRDAVAQIKTSVIEDDSVATVSKGDSSYTGVIIGVMTSIIIALVGAIVGMSVRQAVGRSILPTPFGRMSPKAMASKPNTNVDFGTIHRHEVFSPIRIVEPNGINAERSSSSNSSTVYNEPFSDLDVSSLHVSSKINVIVPSENNTLAEQDYDVPNIYSSKIERPPPHMATLTTAQQISRVYSPINFARLEAQDSVCTGPMLAPCNPVGAIHSSTGKQTFLSATDDGFYATTDLLRNIKTVVSLPTDTISGVASDQHFEQQLMQIAPNKLNLINRLARGLFGDEVHLCQLLTDDSKSAKVLSRRFPSYWTRVEMSKECRAQCKLKHDRLLPLLGLVLPEHPENNYSLVFGYGEVCDMCQFLQEHVAETSALSGRSLSYGCLIYMAKQVAAAMEYLEGNKIIHRDLATRNCLVEANYGVKIAAFGSINSEVYPADYFEMDGRYIPLRWMAWESVTRGKFSSSTDVWSFGVLLWEILTFARDPPMEALNDDEVLHLLMHYQEEEDEPSEMLLTNPILCPKDIYDLMCECWNRNETDRPSFKEIHMFLMRKNLGYDPMIN